MSRLYSFCCEHGESWASYCAQCRTESTKLRAENRDLKARLREVRRLRHENPSNEVDAALDRATDLRMKAWREP